MNYRPTKLVKSKKRVTDHGEVFTPEWMVESMLDLIKDESFRIDARVLEPACGNGNFLIPILQRKLFAVDTRYGKSSFEKQHYALLALMCTYGVELLEDNTNECRDALLNVFMEYLSPDDETTFRSAAEFVLSLNIINGDALAMKTHEGKPITFAEWGYVGKGKFQRRDFRLDVLTGSSAFSAKDSLFGQLGKHELFTPERTFPMMTVRDLAAAKDSGEPMEAA